jgi:hypothetical protein
VVLVEAIFIPNGKAVGKVAAGRDWKLAVCDQQMQEAGSSIKFGDHEEDGPV